MENIERILDTYTKKMKTREGKKIIKENRERIVNITSILKKLLNEMGKIKAIELRIAMFKELNDLFGDILFDIMLMNMEVEKEKFKDKAVG